MVSLYITRAQIFLLPLLLFLLLILLLLFTLLLSDVPVTVSAAVAYAINPRYTTTVGYNIDRRAIDIDRQKDRQTDTRKDTDIISGGNLAPSLGGRKKFFADQDDFFLKKLPFSRPKILMTFFLVIDQVFGVFPLFS